MPDGRIISSVRDTVYPRPLDTGAELLAVITTADGDIIASGEVIPTPAVSEMPRRTAGLIDLQVNGFGGIDFNNDELHPDDMEQALSAMLATGVTTCLPTIITASAKELHSRLRALDNAVAGCRLGPLMVPGYHLEGPFLNPEAGYAGCHPPQYMIAPSIDFVRELEYGLSRPILYLTLAPELENAGSVISWAAQKGKIVGAGHCAPSRSDLASAVAQGIRISTHLGNGVPLTLNRSDNPILRQLAVDEMKASFIADGLHIPPETLKIFIRAKGIERSILVTDAVAAAASSPGRYHLGTMAVDLDQTGRVRAANGYFLAGSSLRLDRAIANIVNWGIADFRDALRMTCANPLTLLKPALEAYGIKVKLGEVHWDACNHPVLVNLGPLTWQAP